MAEGPKHRLIATIMILFMIMRQAKITGGGQISIPSVIRKRWGTSTLTLEDLGDRIVLTPAPDDPIAAARGALSGKLSLSSKELRARARSDEAAAESHRHRPR
jgi:bifunctional DNA-binding transcriptional regulator/antitoxin component of YhaV-PrlF toxin-antitoxin module